MLVTILTKEVWWATLTPNMPYIITRVFSLVGVTFCFS